MLSLNRCLIFSFLILQSSVVWADSQTTPSIAIFDSGSTSPHEAKVKKAFSGEPACQGLKIFSFAVYEINGDLKTKTVLEQIAKAEKTGATIFHFSWNLPGTEDSKPISQQLEKLIKKNNFVVAAAGDAQKTLSERLPVEQTIMGQINGAFVIGEVNANGNLNPQSHYGPGLFAADTAPEGFQGSSFSAVRFTCLLAKSLKTSAPDIVREKLESKRKNTAPKYPTFAELFK